MGRVEEWESERMKDVTEYWTAKEGYGCNGREESKSTSLSYIKTDRFQGCGCPDILKACDKWKTGTAMSICCN